MTSERITKMQRLVLLRAAEHPDGSAPAYPARSPRHADISALVAAGYMEQTLLGPRITAKGRLKHQAGAARRYRKVI